MARSTLPTALIDHPSFLAQDWQGYFHLQDPTVLPFNVLTFPSQNCSIPLKDKIVPDLGKTILGQVANEFVGFNGNQQKFKNLGGIEMEVRTFPSLDPNLKDVVEVLYNGSWLQITQNVNPLPRGVHEVYFDQWFDTNLSPAFSLNSPRLVWVNGYEDTTTHKGLVFSWTGGIAVIVSFVANTSISIDPNTTWESLGFVNPLTAGVINYDTLVGAFVLSETITGGTSGATAIIMTDSNTSLTIRYVAGTFVVGETITGGTSGATAKVTNYYAPQSTGSSGNIIINGLLYTITSGWETNILLTANTAGISVGDIATSQIETDISPIPFDMAKQNKGYMFYGNWKMRDLYMSNAFNRSSNYTITFFQGGLLNDLVIDTGTNVYTGTTESVFHIVIDSITPDVETQTFTGSGPSDAFFDTTGYSVVAGVGGAINHYKISMMADTTLVFVGAPFATTVGETVIGTVSGAQATVIKNITNGGVTWLGVKLLTINMFNFNEAVNFSTTVGAPVLQQAGFQNWIQGTKNNVVFNLNTGFGVLDITPLTTSPIAAAEGMPDGLSITFVNFKFHTSGDVFGLDIRKGGIDTFQWQKDGGDFTSNIPITANAFQPLSDGVQIKFLNANGHTLGDFWNITAIPQVTRAWDNFYYALPVRRPGEGYKFRLPSNFWTMDTQEDSIYVNGSYGDWSVVSTELSSDLQSESVSLTPLKQAGALKVLYPYLTGHINDDLIFVGVDKKLNTLGRQQFLEKPQTGYLSEPVQLDFDASSFIGGRIKYLDKKVYISSPEDAILHCYDTYKKYWQPPKSFPEVALLSIVDNTLITHSNTRNQSYTMFTSTSGDNDMSYTVEIRTPYWSGDRWNQKLSNNSFIEGYIQGNPQLIHTVYLGVEGCGGIFPHEVEPIVCLFTDRAPFGEGPFGSHPNGSDMAIQGSYFAEIWKGYKPVLQYYFIQLGITCTAKTHSYALLGLGMNGMWAESGNNTLVNPSIVVN